MIKIADTLKNLVTGLGTSKDKSQGGAFTFEAITDQELNAMHRKDWLARKIVDIIPNDMTREWRDWQADDKSIEAIERLEKSPLINLQAKVNKALRMARLLGGSAIYIGIRNAQPQEPLELDRIKLGDLQYLHVLNKSEVTAGELETDIQSEFFGEPKGYSISGANGTQLEVHPSRIVRFIGGQILDTRMATANQWGDSVLQIVYDAVQNAGSVQQHIAALIPEAKTDIIYVPQLSKFLENTTTTKQLTDRFAYANMVKSMFGMTLLEGNGGTGDNALGEKWEQKQISFAQLPELAQLFLQIASGAADIPATRLLSQSPAGMNATGESDTRNYYDNISSRQVTELQPRLNRIDEVIIRSATGKRDESIHYTWAPLWGLSEKEKAEVFKTKADGARALAGNGQSSPIMPLDALSEALVNSFIEDGSLPGLEKAIEEYGGLAEQEDDEDDIIAAALPKGKQKPDELADAAPRTLYVSRKLLNAGDLLTWAQENGFKTTLSADDLHVTVTYSRKPVDWFKMGSAWQDEVRVNAGGARQIERYGDATVLLFSSNELIWRHEEMIDKGATWDHPEYQPHVTIAYGFEGEVADIEPYQGELVFGPEIFSEIDENWQSS